MAATTFHSLIIVFWKETASPVEEPWTCVIIIIRVRTIAQKVDSLIVDSIDQNNRPKLEVGGSHTVTGRRDGWKQADAMREAYY